MLQPHEGKTIIEAIVGDQDWTLSDYKHVVAAMKFASSPSKAPILLAVIEINDFLGPKGELLDKIQGVLCTKWDKNKRISVNAYVAELQSIGLLERSIDCGEVRWRWAG